MPSDIRGVLFKKFDKSVEECYKGILEDLKAAGYENKNLNWQSLELKHMNPSPSTVGTLKTLDSF